MNNTHVPFRIIGMINGKYIILRTYADHVTIAIGGELRKFPTYETAMEYLRQLTKLKQARGNHYGE